MDKIGETAKSRQLFSYFSLGHQTFYELVFSVGLSHNFIRTIIDIGQYSVTNAMLFTFGTIRGHNMNSKYVIENFLISLLKQCL